MASNASFRIVNKTGKQLPEEVVAFIREEAVKHGAEEAVVTLENDSISVEFRGKRKTVTAASNSAPKVQEPIEDVVPTFSVAPVNIAQLYEGNMPAWLQAHANVDSSIVDEVTKVITRGKWDKLSDDQLAEVLDNSFKTQFKEGSLAWYFCESVARRLRTSGHVVEDDDDDDDDDDAAPYGELEAKFIDDEEQASDEKANTVDEQPKQPPRKQGTTGGLIGDEEFLDLMNPGVHADDEGKEKRAGTGGEGNGGGEGNDNAGDGRREGKDGGSE